jgi:hypothetical protein
MDATAARILMVQTNAAEITERQEKVFAVIGIFWHLTSNEKRKKAAYNNARVVEVEVVCVVCGTELGTG